MNNHNTCPQNKRPANQNQKMSQWQFGTIHAYSKYKLKAEGISIEKVNEAYTSQTCPVCGKRKKVSSRNYVSRCGYMEHRDIHGAKNILAKYNLVDIFLNSLKEFLIIRDSYSDQANKVE